MKNTKKGGIKMEQKQMMLLFVVGVLIGAIGLYGVGSMTGYAFVLADAGETTAAGIKAQALERHVQMVKDDAKFGLLVQQLLAEKDVLKALQAEGHMLATDKAFVIRGHMLDANGVVQGTPIFFAGITRGGEILPGSSQLFAERLNDVILGQGVEAIVFGIDGPNALLAADGIIFGTQALTADQCLEVYSDVSFGVFDYLGITNSATPFGATGGGNNLV